MIELYYEYLDYLFGVLEKKPHQYSKDKFCWYNDDDYPVLEFTEPIKELWICPWILSDFQTFFDLQEYNYATNIIVEWVKNRLNIDYVLTIDDLPF